MLLAFVRMSIAAAVAAAIYELNIGVSTAAPLACFVVLLLVSCSFVTVGRGQRVILQSFFTGDVRIIGQGIHVARPWETRIMGPWEGLQKHLTTSCPAPGTRVVLDPPPSQLHTKERVPGSVDVTVECVVEPWSETVISNTSRFEADAQRSINQWLCQLLDGCSADNFSFGYLSGVLNAPPALSKLNEKIRLVRLRVVRVHLDPNGVSLDPKYVQQRRQINARMQMIDSEQAKLRREAEVAETRRENDKRELDFKLAQQAAGEHARVRLQLETQAAVEAASLKLKLAAAEHAVSVAELHASAAVVKSKALAAEVQQLVAAGLRPADVAHLKISEMATIAVRQSGASTTLLALPPGMLGMNGLHGIMGTGSSCNARGNDSGLSSVEAT